ncbi:SMR family transporter [uncultured Litoreibacter sp.]|uniref:DMT family transporter n=1 Tax=uncultured Litoreibacter sp. TaxID=1392394 RepID=UPI002637E620|nr:SMR family transporter [uncultured Litoreibacter sp.]
MPAHYFYLILAVAAETIGTSSIQASQQFTRLWPSLLAMVSFAMAFYLLSLTLKVLPVGIMYALWSGLGIIFIAIIGWVYFGQKLDLAAVFGMSLILAGIVVINLLSSTATH